MEILIIRRIVRCSGLVLLHDWKPTDWQLNIVQKTQIWKNFQKFWPHGLQILVSDADLLDSGKQQECKAFSKGKKTCDEFQVTDCK